MNVNLCIVMEFCDGGSLHRKLNEYKKKEERVPEDQVLEWFVQVSIAIQVCYFKVHINVDSLLVGHFLKVRY